MLWIVNLLYLLAAPWIILTLWIRDRRRNRSWPDTWARCRGLVTVDRPTPGVRRLLFHAVSVGEVNAIRPLVESFVADPDVEPIVATSTETGYLRALKAFEGKAQVIRYPLDFPWAVRRFIDSIHPAAVALVELEIWPNFVHACNTRRIPVAVINGRLSERSFRKYRYVRPFLRRAFASLQFAAVQDEEYAARFRAMGVPESKVHVLPSLKWDGIAADEDHAAALAASLGIDRSRPLVVAGSSAPEEHELFRDAMPDGVQLLCAPRRPEWWDEAAAVLEGAARRSKGDQGSETGRFLLDTTGELQAAYALADIAIIGRSFGTRHGSNMMESVMLGKATVVGPAVTDFAEMAHHLVEAGGMLQVEASDLARTIRELINDDAVRAALGRRGRDAGLAFAGGTARHRAMLRSMLSLDAASES